MMKRTVLLGLGVIVLTQISGGTSRALASDRTGIYALIDSVVFEPKGDWKQAERARITGAFALSKGRREYEPPKRGFLYVSLKEDKVEKCRIEWRDLKKLAATRQALGFSTRFHVNPMKVHELGAKKAETEPFILSAYGIRKMRLDTNYAPIRSLRSCPKPLAPIAGSAVSPGKVQLEVAKIFETAHPNAVYHFWIEGPDKKREKSGAVKAKGKKATWTPKLEIASGAKYAWGVRARDEKWKGTESTARFIGKKGKVETKKSKAATKKGKARTKKGKVETEKTRVETGKTRARVSPGSSR